MSDVEEAWAKRRRVAQGLACATRDYYTTQFNSDSARLTAADVMMELIVQDEAAVRDAMLAAFDRGHGVAGGLFLRERARIQALGGPIAGEGEEE